MSKVIKTSEIKDKLDRDILTLITLDLYHGRNPESTVRIIARTLLSKNEVDAVQISNMCRMEYDDKLCELRVTQLGGRFGDV